MSTPRQQFLVELHELFAKYGVTYEEHTAYYPGEFEGFTVGLRGSYADMTLEDLLEGYSPLRARSSRRLVDL